MNTYTVLMSTGKDYSGRKYETTVKADSETGACLEAEQHHFGDYAFEAYRKGPMPDFMFVGGGRF